jgi:hypothetical protein
MALRPTLIALLAALTFSASGVTAVRHARAPHVPQRAHRQELALAQLQLGAAAMAMDQLHEMTGSYEEADLHVLQRVRFVEGDEDHYCVEAVEGDGVVFHVEGPGGAVAEGGC